jgi:hypothetical protein
MLTMYGGALAHACSRHRTSVLKNEYNFKFELSQTSLNLTKFVKIIVIISNNLIFNLGA